MLISDKCVDERPVNHAASLVASFPSHVLFNIEWENDRP